MSRETGVLHWILGALFLATVATAITFGMNHGSTARNLAAPSQTLAVSLPAPPINTVTAPAPQPAPSDTPVAATHADAPSPPLANQASPQNGQIWECMTNGQKTFSNNPCGAKSTVLDIGPVNTMEATPVFHAGRSYAAPPSGYAPPEYSSAPDDTYADAQGSAESSGATYFGVPYAVRIKPQHRRPDYRHENHPSAGNINLPAPMPSHR
jgi:hypothetical protein